MNRNLIGATLALALGGAGIAHAGTIQPISAGAYQAAVASGKPMIVFAKADWCPVCRKERTVIEGLMKEDAFRDYQVLVIDVDANKPAMNLLHIADRGAIIVMRNGKELDRAVGLTDPDAIRGLIAKAG